MNSLTPVTSIAQSLKEIWKKKVSDEEGLASVEEVESTIKGLDVIGIQGEGLVRFVQSYRVLTKVPVPQLTTVSIQSLAERLSILVSPLKTEFGVSIKFQHPNTDFQVQMDEQMIIQVVINLVKNAAEALVKTPDPLILIAVRSLPTGETEITVTDNGPGIPEEILDEIFIPFFTTKASGSGIGLSHSRQNIRALGGTLSCSSQPGKTVFKLQW
jgi:signal transduction histidine kinase